MFVKPYILIRVVRHRFGEYPTGADLFHVWRYTSSGKDWHGIEFGHYHADVAQVR